MKNEVCELNKFKQKGSIMSMCSLYCYLFIVTTLICSFFSVGCNGLITPQPLSIQTSALTLGEVIGNGTFGTVRWATLDREENGETDLVVTKISHKNMKNAAAYLETEAQLNRRLSLNGDHPHIAPYLGECTKDGERHLIWKASGFGTLEDFLEHPEQGTTSLLGESLGIEPLGSQHGIHSLAREVLRQLLEALSYCHSKGIVHRDVKPANILVDDATGSLRLIDFGSAADMASLIYRRGYRGPRRGPRSLLYCAPEEFVEEGHPYAFDVYSAAACWLRIMVPGLRVSEDEFFQFRTAVRDCFHDLGKWHDIAIEKGYSQPLVENGMPEGWEVLFDASPEGRDAFRLLSKLMHYEPSERPSASDALLQPYLNPGCMQPLLPVPPAMPWSITSHMERWAAQNTNEECVIPDWFFDETIILEVDPRDSGFVLGESHESKGVVVVEIIRWGAADVLTQIKEGDQLVAIGLINLADANLLDVNRVLDEWPEDTAFLQFLRHENGLEVLEEDSSATGALSRK
mmetsp:Transcript_22823/g.31910  ORF Transcript_22823/g.31910 Transcript_22823/m.31910 type:complete len:517 (+) Transcript_22823:71-1621(+)